jgi:hypothetical protein
MAIWKKSPQMGMAWKFSHTVAGRIRILAIFAKTYQY